jgi:TPR repeat protein
MIWSSLRIIVLLSFLILTSGFSSEEPLLSENDAVTPFPDAFTLTELDQNGNLKPNEKHELKRSGKTYVYQNVGTSVALTLAECDHGYLMQEVTTVGDKLIINYDYLGVVQKNLLIKLVPPDSGKTDVDAALKKAGIAFTTDVTRFVFSDKSQLLKAAQIYLELFDAASHEPNPVMFGKPSLYRVTTSEQEIAAPQQDIASQNKVASAETPGNLSEHECDILAASPYDLSRPANVPGVEFEKIDAAAAGAACQRAVREHPSPRLFAQLGRAFDAGHNHAEALANYRVAADQESPVGQFYLGFMYATGEGIAMDAGQAVSWYRKAAGQGFAPGQNALGAMYDNGDGVSKDAGQAAFWYRKAAEQGYPPGECNLGSQYYNGTGVARDAAQAVFWYRKAAEHGVADAQFNLALSYQDGAGVAKDDSQAAFWHRKAAEQGYAKAENNLGALYYNAGDVDEAIFWLQKAADQGIAEAKSNLALAYRQQVPSANSFPSAGRNYSDELVDQMRADQRQRDRENADAERADGRKRTADRWRTFSAARNFIISSTSKCIELRRLEQFAQPRKPFP